MAKRFRKSVDYLVLFDTGPKTTNEIISQSNTQYGVVNYHLKRLVQLGYLSRRKDPLQANGYIYELSESEKGKKHNKRDINLDKPTGGRKPHGDDTIRWITGKSKTWKTIVFDVMYRETHGGRTKKNENPVFNMIEQLIINRYDEAKALRSGKVTEPATNQKNRAVYANFVDMLRNAADALEDIINEDRVWNEEIINIFPTQEEVSENNRK